MANSFWGPLLWKGDCDMRLILRLDSNGQQTDCNRKVGSSLRTKRLQLGGVVLVPEASQLVNGLKAISVPSKRPDNSLGALVAQHLQELASQALFAQQQHQRHLQCIS